MLEINFSCLLDCRVKNLPGRHWWMKSVPSKL